MLITDEEAKDLKTWVIKKLEDMYVVAYDIHLALRLSCNGETHADRSQFT